MALTALIETQFHKGSLIEKVSGKPFTVEGLNRNLIGFKRFHDRIVMRPTNNLGGNLQMYRPLDWTQFLTTSTNLIVTVSFSNNNKPDSNQYQQYIVDPTGNIFSRLYFTPSTNLWTFQIFGSSSFTVSNSYFNRQFNVITHHVVWTSGQNGTIYTYVNDVLVNTSVTTALAYNTATPYFRFNGGGYMTEIAYLKLSSGQVTRQDITDEFNNARNIKSITRPTYFYQKQLPKKLIRILEDFSNYPVSTSNTNIMTRNPKIDLLQGYNVGGENSLITERHNSYILTNIATNFGGEDQTDLVDTDENGTADGFTITGGTGSIVTGNGFTGRAQRISTFTGNIVTPVLIDARILSYDYKIYRIRLKYRSDGVVRVNNSTSFHRSYYALPSNTGNAASIDFYVINQYCFYTTTSNLTFVRETGTYFEVGEVDVREVNLFPNKKLLIRNTIAETKHIRIEDNIQIGTKELEFIQNYYNYNPRWYFLAITPRDGYYIKTDVQDYIRLYRIVNNSATQIGISVVKNTNHYYKLKVVTTATTIKVYQEDVEIISVNESITLIPQFQYIFGNNDGWGYQTCCFNKIK